MITIHHLGVSQSERIVWLMEELGLPYRLKWYDRKPNRAAPDEYLALHPTAMAPKTSVRKDRSMSNPSRRRARGHVLICEKRRRNLLVDRLRPELPLDWSARVNTARASLRRMWVEKFLQRKSWGVQCRETLLAGGLAVNFQTAPIERGAQIPR